MPAAFVMGLILIMGTHALYEWSHSQVVLEDPLLAQGVRLIVAAGAEGLPTPSAVLLGGRPPEELPALCWGTPGDERVAVLGGGELEARLSRLADLWAADLPEFRDAAEVDLRFGDQLILRGARRAPRAENNSNKPGRPALARVLGQSQGG